MKIKLIKMEEYETTAKDLVEFYNSFYYDEEKTTIDHVKAVIKDMDKDEIEDFLACGEWHCFMHMMDYGHTLEIVDD